MSNAADLATQIKIQQQQQQQQLHSCRHAIVGFVDALPRQRGS